MCLFFIIVFCFNLFIITHCAFDLEIFPSPPSNFVNWKPSIIITNVDEPLNLTCRLVNLDLNIGIHNTKLTWSWNTTNQKTPYVELDQNTLIFPSIQRSSAGDYTCTCSEFSLQKSVRIKPNMRKAPYCNDNMFKCSNGNCINKLFMCDGKADCHDHLDESVQYCGLDPCKEKLHCEDSRCIPMSWCCDRKANENCTVRNRPKCCMQLYKLPYDEDELYSYHDHANDQQKLNDMGFLQTTIYTVIGCAMAFMFVTTVLVVAICRIHTKRAIMTRCPMGHQNPRLPSQSLSALPMYNLDLFGQESGLLVTYNINNGVQFVGRPVDPPPYCEVIDAPPREGPPPPYVSRENINQVPHQIAAPNPQTLQSDAQPGGDSILNEDEKLAKPAVTLKRESQSEGNISHSVQRCSGSDVFSSLKELGAADESVNIYVNRLCSDKKNEVALKTTTAAATIDSDDDVSYSENDSLLAPQRVATAAEQPSAKANGKRPTTLVLSRAVVNRRGKTVAKGSRRDSDGSAASTCPDYLQRRSLGDLSPSSESFSFDGDVVTMPLRESFIGAFPMELLRQTLKQILTVLVSSFITFLLWRPYFWG